MNKHTPGPWAVCNWMVGNNVLTGETTVCGPNGDEHICTMDGNENNQANAHIIAAAPAMYMELQNIVEGLTDEITRIIEGNKPDTARLDYLANKAGQAVAQAEGRDK